MKSKRMETRGRYQDGKFLDELYGIPHQVGRAIPSGRRKLVKTLAVRAFGQPFQGQGRTQQVATAVLQRVSGASGHGNWYSPSYSPRTQLFYLSAWEGYASIYRKDVYEPGRNFSGGGFTVLTPVPGAPAVGIGRRSPINNWTDAVGHGAVMAIDSRSGEQKWKFDQFDVTDSGILTTASDLLFTGGREGYFPALDAGTGTLLWKASLGGQIVSGPISYEVDGKQYVSVIAGHSLVAFALRN